MCTSPTNAKPQLPSLLHDNILHTYTDSLMQRMPTHAHNVKLKPTLAHNLKCEPIRAYILNYKPTLMLTL